MGLVTNFFCFFFFKHLSWSCFILTQAITRKGCNFPLLWIHKVPLLIQPNMYNPDSLSLSLLWCLDMSTFSHFTNVEFFSKSTEHPDIRYCCCYGDMTERSHRDIENLEAFKIFNRQLLKWLAVHLFLKMLGS